VPGQDVLAGGAGGELVQPGGHRRGEQRRRGRQARHRGDLLARRVGALPVQPGQEILVGQLRRRDPGQQLPAPNPRSRCLIGSAAASSASITPTRPHNSVITARPAFAVSDRSGAPIRAC